MVFDSITTDFFCQNLWNLSYPTTSNILFRFQVHIPENYPDGDVPKIVFENSVFHPSIDPATHVLNVKQVRHF